MLRKITRYLLSLRSLARINLSLSRGAAASAARSVDLTDPASWEFSGFSQNGEDGIIEVLHRHLRRPNRYFLEVGASDGLENNTAWLSVVRRFSGVWIEGGTELSARAAQLFVPLNYGVDVVNMFVTRETIPALLGRLRYTDPDVFSLDIDGNDYHIVSALLDAGLRPKICVLEYNSAFGPSRSVSVPYVGEFRMEHHPNARLFYGCSVTGWRTLFARHGYEFVTVDQNGVNAFFVDRAVIDPAFLAGIKGTAFNENYSQIREHRAGWEAQYTLIADRPLVEIT